jgi:hypothetical protein
MGVLVAALQAREAWMSRREAQYKYDDDALVFRTMLRTFRIESRSGKRIDGAKSSRHKPTPSHNGTVWNMVLSVAPPTAAPPKIRGN